MDILDRFSQVPNTKFHGNPSSGRHADTCGQTDGRTDENEPNRRFFATMRTCLRAQTVYSWQSCKCRKT